MGEMSAVIGDILTCILPEKHRHFDLLYNK